jgi:hypothetical protein
MTLQISDRRLQIGVLLLALLAGGCAAGQAFRKGDAAMRAGNLDEAVDDPPAAQAAPTARRKDALQRAMRRRRRARISKTHQ